MRAAEDGAVRSVATGDLWCGDSLHVVLSQAGEQLALPLPGAFGEVGCVTFVRVGFSLPACRRLA